VLRLLDARTVTALATDPSTLDTPIGRRLRASVVARSRWAEDCVAAAVAAGVRQLVVLGAGLDSFAYRNPFPASALHVFEMDHPATQAWKRERLRAAGLEPPASLTFVPIDFERRTPADALATGGFDTGVPAIVSWLGVTVYLTRDVVLRTLAWVGSLAPGSSIAFTYVARSGEPREAAGAVGAETVATLAARAAAAGEPWITYFDPAELAGELTRVGLALVEDLSPDDATARYFAGRSDRLHPGGSSHLALARVERS